MESIVEKLQSKALELADSMREVFLTRLIAAEKARQNDLIEADERLAQERTNATFPHRATELNEFLCRKHGHQPWCDRMQLLDRYTALAKLSHRTRKRYFNVGGSYNESHMMLCENALTVARNQYRCSECNCSRLTSSDAIQWKMPDAYAELALGF